jgi:protein TonB
VPVAKEIPKPVTKPPKPEVKKVDPNALAIPGGFTKKQYANVDKFRQKQEDKQNQLYSTSGQQLSSEMLAMQGSGRIGLGENSPFGNQFGAYARILRDRVAQAWNTSGIDAGVRTAPVVTVTFTLYRNGSISGTRVTRTSGIATLDRSALRAIADAAPFPQVPPQFPKDQIEIDFVFELKR